MATAAPMPTTAAAEAPKWECCVCYEDGRATAQMTLGCSHPICLGCYTTMRSGTARSPTCPMCRATIRSQAGLTAQEQGDQQGRWYTVQRLRHAAEVAAHAAATADASYQAYVGTNADRQAYHATLQELQRTTHAAAVAQGVAPQGVALRADLLDFTSAATGPLTIGSIEDVDARRALAANPNHPQFYLDHETQRVHRRSDEVAARITALQQDQARPAAPTPTTRCPGCATQRPAADVRHRRMADGRRLMRCSGCRAAQ